MTETHEQRVERLVTEARGAALIRHGVSLSAEVAQSIVQHLIASDREAGLVTVPKRPGKRACLVAQSYLVADMTDSGSTYPGLDAIGNAVRAAIAAQEQEGPQ